MSISSGVSMFSNNEGAGFSIIELLVGLSLATCLAVAIGPLWFSLQNAGACEADQTVQALQARVAIARFERDLRLASSIECPFPQNGPVLQATPQQVVFLVRSGQDTPPVLVEWEIAEGALMRRWGTCPSARPVNFAHTIFADHKTMLEGVGRKTGSFTYLVGGEVVDAGEAVRSLSSIEGVVMRVEGWTAGVRSCLPVVCQASVGR